LLRNHRLQELSHFSLTSLKSKSLRINKFVILGLLNAADLYTCIKCGLFMDFVLQRLRRAFSAFMIIVYEVDVTLWGLVGSDEHRARGDVWVWLREFIRGQFVLLAGWAHRHRQLLSACVAAAELPCACHWHRFWSVVIPNLHNLLLRDWLLTPTLLYSGMMSCVVWKASSRLWLLALETSHFSINRSFAYPLVIKLKLDLLIAHLVRRWLAAQLWWRLTSLSDSTARDWGLEWGHVIEIIVHHWYRLVVSVLDFNNLILGEVIGVNVTSRVVFIHIKEEFWAVVFGK